MSPVGLGTQIVECVKVAALIQLHDERFLKHVFTRKEIARCRERKHSTEAFSAIWACKEAVFRSMGTRRRKGMDWKEVEIRHDRSGDLVILHGEAKMIAERLGVKKFLLSSSHTRKYAMATAVAVG